MRDRKLHAVVAPRTFPSQIAQNTMFGPLLEVEMMKKCTPLRCEVRLQVKMSKNTCSNHFWRFRCRFAWHAQGIVHLVKSEHSSFKTVGRRGTLEEDLQRCISRGRRSTRDMFIRDVRRWGRWSPESGCFLEHQIFRLAKVILRDRCNTSHDLASLFHGRRNALDAWNGKIAKRIGTRPSALHSTFHFWRKSRRIASFLMLPTSTIEEVRRIASFLTLSSSKVEEVSQNCCVFDVVKFKNGGSLAELLRFQACR